MILYYREKNGGYLAIDTATNRYYLRNFGRDHFEGRAAAIPGLVGSACTTGVSREYLRRHCKRVPRRSVPVGWKAIGL
jgi:hypothetical protein